MSPTLLEGLLVIVFILWCITSLPRLYIIVSMYVREYINEFNNAIEEVNEREKENDLSKDK